MLPSLFMDVLPYADPASNSWYEREGSPGIWERAFNNICNSLLCLLTMAIPGSDTMPIRDRDSAQKCPTLAFQDLDANTRLTSGREDFFGTFSTLQGNTAFLELIAILLHLFQVSSFILTNSAI